MTLGQMITDVVGALGTVWTFITGNWLLMALVGLPFVIGAIGALMAVFRNQ